MKPINHLAIAIVIILIPGIVATIIADKLTVHRKWGSFRFGIYSLVFGIASYGLLQFIVYGWDIFSACKIPSQWKHLDVWNIAINSSAVVVPWEVGGATILAIPLAYAVSATINYKLINKLGQKLKVTTKYGEENLYSFYLNAKEINWVYIRDIENNLTYQGEIVSYSENDHMQELVLSDVTVFRYEDSAELYSIPSIYLTKEMGKFVIEAIPTKQLKEETDGKESSQ